MKLLLKKLTIFKVRTWMIQCTLSEEILENPHRWHDMYQWNEKNARILVLEETCFDGCWKKKINEGTKIKEDTYNLRRINAKEHEISYEQENGLKLTCTMIFDKEPYGDEINLQNKPHLCLNKPIIAMRVTNDAKVIKMTIKAEGCNYDKNEGRCLHTNVNFNFLKNIAVLPTSSDKKS